MFKRCNVLYQCIKQYSVSNKTKKASDIGAIDDDLGGLDDDVGGLDNGSNSKIENWTLMKQIDAMLL